jgi:hypothetical protein
MREGTLFGIMFGLGVGAVAVGVTVSRLVVGPAADKGAAPPVVVREAPQPALSSAGSREVAPTALPPGVIRPPQQPVVAAPSVSRPAVVEAPLPPKPYPDSRPVAVIPSPPVDVPSPAAPVDKPVVLAPANSPAATPPAPAAAGVNVQIGTPPDAVSPPVAIVRSGPAPAAAPEPERRSGGARIIQVEPDQH